MKNSVNNVLLNLNELDENGHVDDVIIENDEISEHRNQTNLKALRRWRDEMANLMLNRYLR